MTDLAKADIARAEELAEQALAAEPRSFRSHMAKGQVLRAQGRFEEAIPEYETVIELNRNTAYAISTLGQCKFFTGSLDEAIPLQQRFIRLSPRDPLIGLGPISELGLRICYNRAPTMRSSGSKRRAAPSPNFRMLVRFWPPPMRSKARPNALQLNSPQPAS